VRRLPGAGGGAAQVAAAPDRISRYVIGERIGAGAMGIVHAAFDPELRRRVAIKLLVQRADARLCEKRRRSRASRTRT
jgi:hypothetical protein